MTQRRVLGPASVRWNDYVGTAAADDADALLDRPSLYELAGLDRTRLTIVGADVTLWEDDTTVSVVALDRLKHQVETNADVEELAERLGHLPVRSFDLPDAEVEQFLGQAFKRIAIRLVSRGVRDLELRIEDDKPLV